MFEWFFEFWEWIGQEISSGRFWQPYLKLENWFYVIIIGMTVLYFLVVVQPWNWFRKDENLEVR